MNIGDTITQIKAKETALPGTVAPQMITGEVTKMTKKYVWLKVPYGWGQLPKFLSIKMERSLF